MLVVGAEAHHALHAGAVVPGAVKEDDLAAAREVLYVALEVPGGGLALGRLLQGHGAGTTGVQMLVEALDGATLAGSVTALENNDVLLARVLSPVLELQQLNLQGALGGLVLVATHAFVVGVLVAPGINPMAVRSDQYRIVFIRVVHQVALCSGKINHVEFFFGHVPGFSFA